MCIQHSKINRKLLPATNTLASIPINFLNPIDFISSIHKYFLNYASNQYIPINFLTP